MILTEQFNALSRDSFSALLELSKDRADFLLDHYGKIISCNKDAENITGYTMQEMHGIPFFALCSSADAERSEYLNEIGFWYRVADSSMLRNISRGRFPEVRGYVIKKYAEQIADLLIREEKEMKQIKAKFSYMQKHPARGIAKLILGRDI